jgi:hypothetical protein
VRGFFQTRIPAQNSCPEIVFQTIFRTFISQTFLKTLIFESKLAEDHFQLQALGFLAKFQRVGNNLPTIMAIEDAIPIPNCRRDKIKVLVKSLVDAVFWHVVC